MSEVASFPPIAAPDATVLILGTAPGRASLAAQQYYALPQNAFWKIMDDLYGAARSLPYEERVRILVRERVAVWDVLAKCVRKGSLDSAIEPGSMIIPDFQSFFAMHPRIRRIAFNGTTAEACFRRHVLPDLEPGRHALVRLPSTSPAHAGRSYAQKLEAWRAALITA
jgi:double-stranded uracil-DNA glycosylase